METEQALKLLAKAFLFALVGMTACGLIAPTIVFLDISGVTLSSGFDWIDSLLYSMPGLMGIAWLSVIHAMYGAFAGFICGLSWGLLRQAPR